MRGKSLLGPFPLGDRGVVEKTLGQGNSGGRLFLVGISGKDYRMRSIDYVLLE